MCGNIVGQGNIVLIGAIILHLYRLYSNDDKVIVLLLLLCVSPYAKEGEEIGTKRIQIAVDLLFMWQHC